VTIEAGPDELFTTKAREADAEAIAILVNSAYRGPGSHRGWTTEADYIGGQRTDPDAVLATIRTPQNAILVVRGQKGLNACVHVERQAADVAYISMLTVRPPLQGSQLGRHLLAAAETFARREYGARFIEMNVLELREELIAWYERRGYLPTGEQRPFPYGDERIGIPVRDDLRFIVLRRELTR
jgi:ribosomal protein S18 acetylase RimI-like enzyme